METLSVHLTFSLSVMETCSGLSPITPLKMKIPSGQEAFNYTIDQSYLKDYELLISAVKKSNYMPKNNICNAVGFENTCIATHIKNT